MYSIHLNKVILVGVEIISGDSSDYVIRLYQHLHVRQELLGEAGVYPRAFSTLLSSSLFPVSRLPSNFPRDAGMRRSVFRAKLARSNLLYLPRFDGQSSQPCRARAFSTTGKALSDNNHPARSNIAPFRFETGLSLFAKRAPRPFPPPFLSPPSGSFSDPLSTHHRSRDRRTFVNGDLIRGYTNGDDAVYVSDMFIGANDGVGAWSTRPGGHAGLVLCINIKANAK